jgi:hypothetical protein
MTQQLPTINSHNGWSPLEEVWLGDVFPSHWYNHLSPDVRDVFHRLTEMTQQDLNVIQQTIEKFGVVVRRPEFKSIDDYLNDQDILQKPPIAPRDEHVVVGNTLYKVDTMDPSWDHVIDQYRLDTQCQIKWSPSQFIHGANLVRVGRDIVIDHDPEVTNYVYNNDFPDYRVQTVNNGGHIDGCFSILKPGLILANHYYDEYEETFPGWEVIFLDNPTYHDHQINGRKIGPITGDLIPYPLFNGKFWETSMVGGTRTFNEYVVKHALDWVGDYRETYFELNCLVIDEQNVIMLAQNDKLARDLQKHGITVHWVPFRTRSFWDGAMHCLTVDIRRRSTIVDYFPQRQQTNLT